MIVLEKMVETAVVAVVEANVTVAVAVLLNESANFYIQSKPVAKIGVECKTLHTMLSSSHHLMRH